MSFRTLDKIDKAFQLTVDVDAEPTSNDASKQCTVRLNAAVQLKRPNCLIISFRKHANMFAHVWYVWSSNFHQFPKLFLLSSGIGLAQRARGTAQKPREAKNRKIGSHGCPTFFFYRSRFIGKHNTVMFFSFFYMRKICILGGDFGSTILFGC